MIKKRPASLRQSLLGSLFFRVQEHMVGVALKWSKPYLTLIAKLGNVRVSRVELVLKRSWRAQAEALYLTGFSESHTMSGQDRLLVIAAVDPGLTGS